MEPTIQVRTKAVFSVLAGYGLEGSRIQNRGQIEDKPRQHVFTRNCGRFVKVSIGNAIAQALLQADRQLG